MVYFCQMKPFFFNLTHIILSITTTSLDLIDRVGHVKVQILIFNNSSSNDWFFSGWKLIDLHILMNWDLKIAFRTERSSNCSLWYAETRPIIVTGRKFSNTYTRNGITTTSRNIDNWLNKFKSTGTLEDSKHHQPSRLNTAADINQFETYQKFFKISFPIISSYKSVNAILK